MGMDGGGKLPYSYGGGHHDAKLVKSVSRVEPRKFGIGLVAGFLLVTCAYFSTAKFDAIHIALMSPSDENVAGIGSLVTAADGSKQQLDLDREALSKEGSRAEMLDNDDDKVSSSAPDSGRNASLEKDETFVGDGDDARVGAAAPNPAAVVGKDDRVRAKDDDAVLPAVPPSEESANSTQESGVLEDEELQVQDALANAARKNKSESSTSNGGGGSPPTVVPSDPAVLPAPVPVQQQTPHASSSEVKAPAERQIPPVQEIKRPGSQSFCSGTGMGGGRTGPSLQFFRLRGV